MKVIITKNIDYLGFVHGPDTDKAKLQTRIVRRLLEDTLELLDGAEWLVVFDEEEKPCAK